MLFMPLPAAVVKNFAQTVMSAHADNDILPTNHRSRLSKAINDVLNRQKHLFPEDTLGKHKTCDELMDVVRPAAQSIIADEKERNSILLKMEQAAKASELTSIEELVRAIEVENDDIEPEIDEGKVNILDNAPCKRAYC